MSFTTVNDVALFINKKVADLTTLELAQVTAMIPFIDGVINNYCGWNMLATDYTNQRLDGTGTNTMDLRLTPINTITAIRERTADGSFTDVTAKIEELGDGTIQFLPSVGGTFTKGVKNYFLTYNAGYKDGAIPSDLIWAGSFLVSINYNKISNNAIGIKTQKNVDFEVELDSIELPILVKRVLDRYRMVSIF